MPIMESTATKIVWTTFIFSGISLPFYGIEALFVGMLLYLLMNGFDFFTGFLAARKKQKILSKTFINGVLEKMTIYLFILLMVFLTTGVISFIGEYNVDIFGLIFNINILIGLIPHFFIIMFAGGELISILENLSVIFSGKREGIIFQLFSSLTIKIFNLSLESIKDYSEKKIDEKFKKNIKN